MQKGTQGVTAAVPHPVPRRSWRPGMNLCHDQGITQWRDPDWHWRMAERTTSAAFGMKADEMVNTT